MVKACYNNYMSVKRIEPIEIDKFFTKEQIDLVYKVIDAKMEKGRIEKNDPYGEMFRFSNNGFITNYRDWPKELQDIIKNKAEELGQGSVPYENTILIFARYTHDSGGAPNLPPHADVVVNKTMYTCTVRLNSSKQWDFYVKDQKFVMGEHGSAVWFTGNQDIHWRPDLEFAKDEYYDILLCQAWSNEDNEIYPDGYKETLDEQEKVYSEKYKDMLKIGQSREKGSNTDCVGISDGQDKNDAYNMAKETGVKGVDYSKA
jgi:hypothetical protein